VFENRVLRRIFGPKMDELTGGLRELHNEEFHVPYLSLNIMRIIKLRRMERAEHATLSTCMSEMHWLT
jgi:hypothetical protein